jgi:hypothetical protein
MHATRESGSDPARTTGSGGRWLSVGSSAGADSRRAGAAATARAVVRDDVRLLVAFCSALHDPEAVLAGIRSVAPGAPLVGCSSTAVIGPAGPSQGGGVVVVALGGPGFSVATGFGLGAAGRQRDAGAEVAGCVADVADGPHQVLLLLTDGLVSGQEEILAGAYSVVGASVPLVGGSSSPDPTVRHTFQFHGDAARGDRVIADAVVGAAIASDGPLGVGLRHGWRKVGEPMIVTKSAHGDVFTLDDQPALSAYLQRLNGPADAYTDPAVFEAFAQTRPIGVRRRSGEEVRTVSSTDRLREGWLRSTGEVPEGGLIWLMEGDEDSVLQAAGDACADAVRALAGQPPLGLMVFDCESRGRLLGADGMRQEVARMTGQAQGAPLAGLYTWGEIARTKGINGFHNQTLVVLAVG